MISYVKGKVAYTDTESIVIDVQGIGYQIRTSLSNINQVMAGQEVLIFTSLYVREDVMALYGFLTREELKTFTLLLGVSGIGPKAALSVLSTMTVKDLYYAVLSDDSKAIAKTPGIGPKGAKKMILELKDKLQLEDVEEDLGGLAASPSAGGSLDQLDSVADAMEALIALGYSNGEAYRAVHNISGAENMDTESLIKEALKKMI